MWIFPPHWPLSSVCLRAYVCVCVCYDSIQTSAKSLGNLEGGTGQGGPERQDGKVDLKREKEDSSSSMAQILLPCSSTLFLPLLFFIAPDDSWNPSSWNAMGQSTVKKQKTNLKGTWSETRFRLLNGSKFCLCFSGIPLGRSQVIDYIDRVCKKIIISKWLLCALMS